MDQEIHAQTAELEESDGSNGAEKQLVHEEGEAYRRALEHMLRKEMPGNEQYGGDYLIACIVVPAASMYEWDDVGLQWRELFEENAYIKITVRDATDGRFVPGLTVRVTVTDKAGAIMGAHVPPFVWDPWLYHYGDNWIIPWDGDYDILVHIDVPEFPRRDRIYGKRYREPVEVCFCNVRIKTGQKQE